MAPEAAASPAPPRPAAPVLPSKPADPQKPSGQAPLAPDARANAAQPKPAGRPAPAAPAPPAPATEARKQPTRQAPVTAAPEARADAAQPKSASQSPPASAAPPPAQRVETEKTPIATPSAVAPDAAARAAGPAPSSLPPMVAAGGPRVRAADVTIGATARGPLEVAADARARAPGLAPAAASRPAPVSEPPPAAAQIGNVDIEQFSRNIARMVEEGGKAVAAYLKPREEGKIASETAEDVTDVVKTLGHVAEYWLGDPKRAMEVQTNLGKAYLDLWATSMRRMAGENAEPVATPDPRDRRFADPEWSSNQFFDFLKQAYLLSAQWADRLVREAQGLDAHTRQKAEFYVRQIANAVSPSNFVLTNPELLRETLSSNADNLVRGMHMLAEDITAGRGYLKIRQSDGSKFEVGRNLALSPGKVIFQNELMQLIQYAPSTETVLRRPLLIVPPWINKFYILDLTPEKSFIKYCVDQGLTVFVISWVNPDEHLAAKSFEDYMREGPLAALDIVEEVTGERQAHAIGYCVGGTLLSVTLAWMAAKGDDRIVSATLFAAQTDFTYAGDLKVFVDEERLQMLERQMKERGYLEGQRMATAFNLLRSNDLIWPYVINNYIKGQAPFPFDLLYWNSDATRMPAANQSFYMRNCYLENKLSKGEMVIGDETLDLGKITVPVYNLATREDHIAPARSAFLGSKFFGGPVTFVLAGSGHIAGVVNPPYKVKYQYWTGGAPTGNVESWIAKAQEHPGSWWPHWVGWIEAQDSSRVPARAPGGGKRQPIEDAPGSYVREQF
jgi:polyhydroxyalkanoate synthase